MGRQQNTSRTNTLNEKALLLLLAGAVIIALTTIITSRDGPTSLHLPDNFGICHVYAIDFMMVDREGNFGGRQTGEERYFECDIVTAPQFEENDDYVSFTLPHLVVKENMKALRDNEWYIMFDQKWVVDGTLVIPPNESIESVSNSEMQKILRNRHNLRQRQLQDKKGKIIIVRVTTFDKQVEQDAGTLYNAILGNEFSLKTQYEACSQGELKLSAFDPEHPVLEITVGKNTSDYDYNGIFLEANPQVKKYFEVGSLKNTVDHAIYVVPYGIQDPPGTPSNLEIVAWAGVNHFKAVFTDKWIESTGLMLHETGHNRGLWHAWEDDDEYGDVTGAMGRPIKAVHRTCYNGLHFWGLGWMADKTIMIEPKAIAERIDLVAFTDYQDATDGQATILNVGSYWLVYNRKKSFNSDTYERGDQVTIVEKFGDKDGPVASNMVASIDGANPLFKQLNYDEPGVHLYIEVCNVQTSPDRMNLGIGTNPKPCKQRKETKEKPDELTMAPSSLTKAPEPESEPTSTPVKNQEEPKVPIYIKDWNKNYERAHGTVCDDYYGVLFYVNSTIGHEGCIWLWDHLTESHNATHTNEQAFCIHGHDAYHFCEETCGKCHDDCYDAPKETEFHYLGGPRNCDWVHSHQFLWKIACARNDIKGLCHETCQSCDG